MAHDWAEPQPVALVLAGVLAGLVVPRCIELAGVHQAGALAPSWRGMLALVVLPL